MVRWLYIEFGPVELIPFLHIQPTPICSIEHLTRITITREDDVTHCVSAYVSADKFVTFAMDDRDAVEFALVLAGYYRLLAGEWVCFLEVYIIGPAQPGGLNV